MKKFIVIFLFFPLLLFQQAKKIDSLMIVLNKLPEDSVRVNLYLALCWEWSFSNPDTATNYAKKAMSLAQKIKYQNGLATGHVDLGIVYNKQAKFSEAIKEFETGLNIFSSLKYKEGMGIAYSGLANSYSMKGDFGLAIKNLITALKLMEESGYKKGLAINYGNLGIMYLKVKDYDKAIECFNYHLKIKERSGDKYGMITPLQNIAFAYITMGDYDKALPILFRTIKLCNEKGNKQELSIALNQLGAIYFNRSEFAEAEKYYSQSLEISKEIYDKQGIAMALSALGNICLETTKYDQALDHFNKAYETAASIGAKEEMKETLLDLSAVYEKKGNPAGALKYYKLFSDMKDSLLNKEISNQISEISARYESEKKENTIKLLSKERELQTAESARKEAEFRSFRNTVIIGSALILLILGGMFFYIRNKRITEKIKMEKQLVELEQQALRLQMNPHFIFNSLSSINNFIGKNEAAEAKKFLTKFSKLMRLILENSREEYVPLQREIDSLTYYMELEQLRINNKFTFEIVTDKEIDAENDLVPPMLIQPHVENSIHHGIIPKDKNGKILLSFIKQNGGIVCNIQDDGIGREKAGEIKKQSGLTHKSLAITVTQERLNILYPDAGKNNSIIIKDLKGDDGTPTGTLVSFKLPSKQHI